MNWHSLACPNCGTRNQFLLSTEKDSHLRQCPACDRWMVAHRETAGDASYRIDALANPPTCPVDGCSDVVEDDQLPEHIIDRHDGSLE